MSFGSKNTSSTNQSTASTQTRDPWAPAQGALLDTMHKTQSLMNSPGASAAYGGPRVAQMSGTTQAGLDAMSNTAGYDQARDYLSRSVAGEYINAGNPYLKQLQDQVAASVMPGMNATFARAGMNGSTQHQGMLAQGLANGMAQPLFQTYESERARQQAAAGALPQVDQARAAALLTAGQTGEQYDQRNLDAAYTAFNEARDQPMKTLQNGYSILGNIAQQGGSGSSTGQTSGTTTQSTTPGLGSSILGGAMALGGLASGGVFGGLGNLGGGMINSAIYGNNGLPWAANPNATWNGSTWR